VVVQAKLAKNKYSNLNQVADDLDLMFDNATTFNLAGSVLFKVCFDLGAG